MHSLQTAKAFTLSYPITRPLPHPKWSLAILLIGGSILATLFTFVAVATTGYNVQFQHTSDPNATESRRQWFQKAPFSYLGSLQTSCQASVLSTADTMMTTNQGFVYTLESISTIDGNSSKALSQISYKNTTLHNCNVAEMMVYLHRSVPSLNTGQWWTWGTTTAYALVTCDMINASPESTLVRANFSVALPGGQLQELDRVFEASPDSGPKAMDYGMILLHFWYIRVISSMAYATPGLGKDNYADGIIRLYPNKNISDWRNIDQIGLQLNIATEFGRLCQGPSDPTFTGWMQSAAKDYLPGNWVTVNAFAKSFYSVLATDFGIKSANALLSPDGIKYLRDQNDTFVHKGFKNCQSLGLGWACSDSTMPDLEIDEQDNVADLPTARLVTQYLCSVPAMKSTVSIVYSVMLAVLVFLQAAYVFFIFTAKLLANLHDVHAEDCVGCTSTSGSLRPALSSRTTGFSDLERQGSEDNLLLAKGDLRMREMV